MMIARARTMQVVRVAVGHGAMMKPGRAALAVAVVLALAALVWLLVARPWQPADVAPPQAPGRVSLAQINDLLSREGYGPGGSDVTMIWGTPEYFRLSGQLATAKEYDTDHNLVFLTWENLHDRDLPQGMQPRLRVDNGAEYLPAQIKVPADAVHHRFSVFLYPRFNAEGKPVISDQAKSLEVILPSANNAGTQSVMEWTLPIAYPAGAVSGPVSFTWGTILALLGGVLASMWPCLFQLTAYFIPSLAGLSMSQAKQQEQQKLMRGRVIKTAVFFVLGFVIVYTLAGAAAGAAAKSLNSTTLFWGWRQYISIGAGIVLLLTALRLAANSRAPLACKMPLGSFLGKNPGPLGTMVLGVAFAAGCTTCFGAALILGMFTYVGIAGNALSGAMIMAAFSLGMAIPLMAGAAAMAKVLSLLTKLEKVAPYIILASAAIMAIFAVLLLSGHSMTLSNLFLRSP